MKKHGWWMATLATLVLMTLLSAGQGGPTDASSLSRGSSGWSAARWYIKGMGSPIRTLDAPIAESLGDTDVLVVTGSGSEPSGFSTGDVETVQRFVRKGGRLIFGYGSGVRASALGKRLGFGFKASANRPRSLNPIVWVEEASKTYHLPLGGNGPAVAMGAVSEYPAEAPGDLVLVRNPQNESLALLRPFGKGEIALLPVETLSNGRLNQPGNSALLEGIRVRFGQTSEWTFDEYHHGVASAASPSGVRSRRGLDLFAFQILLAYGLFVAAIGRRFGSGWPEPVASSGATGSFLMTVAGIHDRLGHHQDAALTLETRAREVLGVEISPPGARAPDGVRTLMEVSRRIHEKQKERRV